MRMEGDAPVIPPAGSPDDPANPRPAAVSSKAAVAVAFADPHKRERRFPLKHALEVDGVRVDAFTLCRLTGQQLFDMVRDNDTEESLTRRVQAAIAGMPLEVIDALDADDALAFADAVRPFLPAILAESPRDPAESPGEASDQA